ncbi:hypothetical protein BC628DRAFT_1394067 [Trametes gibbosa]|nr:hypothetical protein BC628DRAFT_1394067 [Trametes gibbosa]
MGVYKPFDVNQGERYYNPFAFDVACLGNVYLYWLSKSVSAVPLLAPLFGRMTTSVVNDRWNAEEALTFVREIRAGLTWETLSSQAAQEADLECLDEPELYWHYLSTEFQSRWKSHRPPRTSWLTKWVQRANGTHTGCWIIGHMRRILNI